MLFGRIVSDNLSDNMIESRRNFVVFIISAISSLCVVSSYDVLVDLNSSYKLNISDDETYDLDLLVTWENTTDITVDYWMYIVYVRQDGGMLKSIGSDDDDGSSSGDGGCDECLPETEASNNITNQDEFYYCGEEYKLLQKTARGVTLKNMTLGERYTFELRGGKKCRIGPTNSKVIVAFCLDSIGSTKDFDWARKFCKTVGTGYYITGPVVNITLVQQKYDVTTGMMKAILSWRKPLDIANNTAIAKYCVGRNECVPADKNVKNEYKYDVYGMPGESFTKTIYSVCGICPYPKKNGYPSKYTFTMNNINDTCYPDDGPSYCDDNAFCERTNSHRECKCYHGYDGNGVNTRLSNGTGCYLSCSTRNAANHTCYKYSLCSMDDNKASCSCPQNTFGDGHRGRSRCINIVALVGPAIAAMLLICTIAAYLSYKRHKNAMERHLEIFVTDNGQEEDSEFSHQENNIHNVFGKWEVNPDNVTIKEILGRGKFSKVHKAILRKGEGEYVDVAVKIPIDAKPDQEFLWEIDLLISIGNHENILGMVGCCTSGSTTMLITEYMEYGDLLQFLLNSREDLNCDKDEMYNLTEYDVYKIGRQVTCGMQHLVKLKIIHGDLAARNILVGKNLWCKIGDFGLANDVYRNGVISGAMEKKVPFKWISPERMMGGKVPITWRSDVWSMGILLYEIVTLGDEPFSSIKSKILYKQLKNGYRMARPINCSNDLYQIISKCWQWTPSRRPTFQDLQELLATPKKCVEYVSLRKVQTVTTPELFDC